MGLFKIVFKACDKPKNHPDGSRNNFFFGRTTRGRCGGEDIGSVYDGSGLLFV
jgi:hypothetical protein